MAKKVVTKKSSKRLVFSEKTNLTIMKTIKQSIGDTPESELEQVDKNSLGAGIAIELTQTYSWKAQSYDQEGATPPRDKPYGSLYFRGSDSSGIYLSLEVSNSFEIKDELKSRGYRYSNRIWYIGGTPEEIKSEIGYLNGRGIETKFGDGNQFDERRIMVYNVLLGQTRKQEFTKAAMTGPVDDGIAMIVSAIQESAKIYGIKQND